MYVDFPTTDGIIYPGDVVERAIKASEQKIKDGLMVGGVYDEASPFTPINGMVTHKVIKIFIYNGEVAVEVETIENEEVNKLLDTVKHKKAAIVTKIPARYGGSGTTVRKIVSIECVHIREDRYAQPNGGNPEDQNSGGQERESGPDA
jgi:hypothetical protein